MTDTLRFILSLSIGLAAILGIVRFRKIDKSYYPFVYNVTLAFIVEIIVRIFTKTRNIEAFGITLSLYSLVDFILFAWLFHNWGLFNRNKTVFASLIGLFSAGWLTFVIINGFLLENFYYLILYSFALIFFSVTTFNKVVVHERGSILRNAKFLICLGIIIFYTFFVVLCAFQLSFFSHSIGPALRRNVFQINVYSNLLVNLLYALAVVWIPKNKNFTSVYKS